MRGSFFGFKNKTSGGGKERDLIKKDIFKRNYTEKVNCKRKNNKRERKAINFYL